MLGAPPGARKIFFVYFSFSYQKDKKALGLAIISIEHECAKDTDFDQVIKEFAMKLARAHEFGYTTV